MELEKETIAQVIDAYTQGSFQGSRVLLEKAFMQDAEMYGSMNGRYVAMTAKAYMDGICQGKSMADSGTDFRAEMVACSIYDHVASVVVREYNFGGTSDFTDLFHLVKIGAEWKIVSKTFCAG